MSFSIGAFATALLLAQRYPEWYAEESTNISITTYRNVRAVSDMEGRWLVHPKIRFIRGLAVYRNGLRMTPEIDYTFESHTALITPAARWNDTDTVLVDFDVQQ